VRGAIPFALISCAEALWMFGYIVELVSPSLEAKVLWDNIQWIGLVAIAPLSLAFALQYTGHSPSRPMLLWGALSAAPVLFLVLAFTDARHGLIRPDARLVPGQPFSALMYQFSVTSWLAFIYCYALILRAYSLLLDTLARPQRLYRAQTGIVLLGSLIPLIGSVLPFMDVSLTFQRDVAPFTFGIGNLIIAWGLFRYRLFDVVPVAREAVIESMRDAVIVLDAGQRLVDVNPAALAFVGRRASEIIGQPAREVLPDWPALTAACENDALHQQVLVSTKREGRHFDLRRSPLYDEQDHLTGCLIVLQDVTERRHAQKEREDLIEELQDALASIKTLQGLIPICASCKKVRDDEGYWHQVEVYLETHSDADISHGICPECARLLYSDSPPGEAPDEILFLSQP
jgi:PAS domain S-box-containing protein